MKLLILSVTPLLLAAAWIDEMGGHVTRDASARVVAVDLRGAWVTDTDMDRLTEYPELTRLNLSHTRITDDGLRRLRALKNLREIDLTFAELITDEGLTILKDWTHIEKLNVRGCHITDAGLAHLSGIATLQSLDIGWGQITESGLDRLSDLTNLRELHLGGNKISDAGLSFLRMLPDLRILDLNGLQRTDSGLWGVTLTDRGLEVIASLKLLESLDLGGAKVTDLGLASLAGLAHMESLNLDRTQVSAKGLQALSRLPVERLSLANAVRIGDDAVPLFVAWKSLRWLDLSGSKLTDAVRATLRAGRPDCRIE